MTPTDEEVADALRERLRAADRDVQPPPDLWQRIRTTATRPRADEAPPRTCRFRRFAVVGGAVAAVVTAAVLAWQLSGRSDQHDILPAGQHPTLTVYNVEKPCQPLHTLECALRLARDPRARYAAVDNSAGHVWHGNTVTALCVVTDGALVADETDMTSTRWYLVRTAAGVQGWLPGVRTRNTVEVRVCGTDEVPHAWVDGFTPLDNTNSRSSRWAR
jgi:hypothetical protein